MTNGQKNMDKKDFGTCKCHEAAVNRSKLRLILTLSALEELHIRENAVNEETARYIYARSEEMASNPDRYPGYNKLTPLMQEILNRIPILRGQRETPDILYWAALGYLKSKEAR